MMVALIVAAGKGVRMAAPMRKQYLPLGGRCILAQTLKAFDRCMQIDRMVIVVPAEDIAFCRDEVIASLGLRAHTQLAAGGSRRQDSVYNGLELLSEEGFVLIHDAVRPLVSQALIESCIQGAQRWNACIPVVAVTDTLKKVDPQGRIEHTVERQGLYMAQTPQVFRISLIKQAHQMARHNDWAATDDASLIERAGGDVHVVPGSVNNIKITTPEDLRRAEALQCDLLSSE